MTEAEVSLRLAFHLLDHDLVSSEVHVAIDGAQVKTLDTVHFPIEAFLSNNRCTPCSPCLKWQGSYSYGNSHINIVVHSNSGCGDVVATLKSGQQLRVESKKGTLSRSKSSSEYRLIREALGQLMTLESVGDDDILAVAVPMSDKFEELARRWRQAPLVKKLGFRLITVDRAGSVNGLSDLLL